MNLIVLRSAIAADGDAAHFDVLQGAANDVIGLIRLHLGVEQRGSIVLQNIDASLSAAADIVSARRTWFESSRRSGVRCQARVRRGGTDPPSWFGLLVIAGLIAAVGILTNSQILIVGAMVVGPEYGAIISLCSSL